MAAEEQIPRLHRTAVHRHPDSDAAGQETGEDHAEVFLNAGRLGVELLLGLGVPHRQAVDVEPLQALPDHRRADAPVRSSFVSAGNRADVSGNFSTGSRSRARVSMVSSSVPCSRRHSLVADTTARSQVRTASAAPASRSCRNR